MVKQLQGAHLKIFFTFMSVLIQFLKIGTYLKHIPFIYLTLVKTQIL